MHGTGHFAIYGPAHTRPADAELLWSIAFHGRPARTFVATPAPVAGPMRAGRPRSHEAPAFRLTLQKGRGRVRQPGASPTRESNVLCGGTFLEAIGLGTAVVRTGSLRDSE